MSRRSTLAAAKDLRRRWGVLFQDGALFSSLTVAENIQVPMREFLALPQPLMDELSGYKVAMAGLPIEAGPKFPSELSGGMRKRAGLARALALDPLLLFLDEPTAGLDPISAAAFDDLIKVLKQTLELTVFLITHDLDTLHAICDRVAVLADPQGAGGGNHSGADAVRSSLDSRIFLRPARPSRTGWGRSTRQDSRTDGSRLMETRSNYAIVGGVVVGIVIALFIAILWLSRFSGEQKQIFDIFFKQSVNGLAVGSPVAFSGVPVGKIDEIKLLPATPQFVRVRISVSPDVPVLKGTTAAVEGVGFTGVSQIQLAGAMQGAQPISEPGPFGVPVIPARSGALGQLLASAPELLNNVSKLTDRLGELLDPENRNSFKHILANTDRATAALADRSPELLQTVAEARNTLRAATGTLQRIDALAGSTNALINSDGKPLIADLRATVKSAQASLARVDALTESAKPGIETLTTQTLPEVGQLIRDLRGVTSSLGAVSAKLDEDPAGALIGGRTLPDYNPPKPEKAK